MALAFVVVMRCSRADDDDLRALERGAAAAIGTYIHTNMREIRMRTAISEIDSRTKGHFTTYKKKGFSGARIVVGQNFYQHYEKIKGLRYTNIRVKAAEHERQWGCEGMRETY